MRVCNNHESSLGFLDNSVESVDLVLREGGTVENKIFFVLSIFNVTPQNIYWESCCSEIVTSFNQHLSRVVFPLTEMETKRVDARDRGISTNFREGFRNLFRAKYRSKDEELHSATLTSETSMSASSIFLRVDILE